MTMSLIAGVAAFVLTVLAMPHFITYYKIKKIGGQQMHEDVKQHLAKAGTPTMGGTVFLVVAILVSLIFNFHVFSEGHQAYGAVISIALRVEWTLLLIGVVYVFETVSVMLQVSYFKYTKRKYGEGRRIFRMTPFHHHLELGGLSGKGDKWSEWKVDAFLWTVGALASAITLWMVLGNVMK